MEINLSEIKNAFLCVGNDIIGGTICEINPSMSKLLFEFKPDSPLAIANMGTRGEALFEYNGNRYFIAGKVFFQPPSKALMTTETNAEIEKRKERRCETPSLPATISYATGIFKKRRIIKSTIINISLGGARTKTAEPLFNNICYDIKTTFPYRHSQLDFKASFFLKNTDSFRDLYISGVQFTELDLVSESNLKRYLFKRK